MKQGVRFNNYPYCDLYISSEFIFLHDERYKEIKIFQRKEKRRREVFYEEIYEVNMSRTDYDLINY